MADTRIEINTGTLGRDIGSIDGEIRKINTQINNLKSTLSQLQSMWDGPAKTAFSTEVTEDIARLSVLTADISRFTRSTEEAKIAYETCERNAGQIIDSIRV